MKKNHKHIYQNILLLLLFFSILPAISYADTLTVGKNHKHKTFTAALQESKKGDVIIVESGIYKEGSLIIKKEITILGKNFPVFDGENKHENMTVFADNVHIEGLHFKNSGAASIKDIAALRIQSTRYCKIINNKFTDNFFSIYLSGSAHCLVKNNYVTASKGGESNSGNGIHLWTTDSSHITGNTVIGQRDGIYFEFVKQSLIEHNLSTGNIRYGLHFMFSDGNIYQYNTFKKNGSGVAVMYTNNIIMRYNRFEDNWGSAAYGLLLKEIARSTVHHNIFNKNTVGLFADGSSKVNIYSNDFRSNGWAMKVLSNSLEDSIYYNNFISNTFDFSSNGPMDNNVIWQNYWDKYRGYDLDKNGIGDVPYRPVSLFSIIVERMPNAMMFLRSVVADILDQVEKVQPDVIPESLTDTEPLMKTIIHKKPVKILNKLAHFSYIQITEIEENTNKNKSNNIPFENKINTLNAVLNNYQIKTKKS